MSSPLVQDISSSIDPTGYTSVSGADLLQMLNGEIVADDKGMLLSTTDDGSGNPTVPDARTDSSTTATKWQRYLWRRISATAISIYTWNPAAAVDATLLQWQPIAQAAIGVGSIINSMIADNTIQSVKIVSLDYSKLTGAPSGLPPSGTAGGDLTGTYPNPSIGAQKVVTANVALLNITNALIEDASATTGITIGKMAPVSGSAKDMARVKADLSGMEAFTPPILFTGGIVVPGGNALKIPQVNAGGTDFQMVSLTTVGARILQIVETQDNTADTTNLNCDKDTLPTTSNMKLPAGLQAAITPVSGSSTLLVEVGVHMCDSGSPGTGTIGLFQDAGANAIAAAAHNIQNNNRPVQCVLRYKVASGSTTARTFKVGFASAAGTTTYNSTDGSTKLFGGTLGVNSWIRVTEYI